jgi:transposase
MIDFFWFSNAQWALIEPLLPTDVLGMPRVDDRRMARSRWLVHPKPRSIV